MSTPAISIIMPTYNRGYRIADTIQTVLDQTVSEWELLIVDDGSTDNTATVIEQIGDERIRYFHQRNQGPVAARNYGLTKARADWIAYLDSDDELFPLCVERILYWVNHTPNAVFGFPRAKRSLELYQDGQLVRSIDDSDDTPPSLTLREMFNRKANMNPNGFFHRRSVINEGLRWDEIGHPMEDWELAMTIGQRYPDGFLYISEVLVHYHQRFGGDGIVSSKQYSDWAETFERIYQKHKHDKLMADQDWYPRKVHKWRQRQAEFEAGTQPPYYQYHFQQE